MNVYDKLLAVLIEGSEKAFRYFEFCVEQSDADMS